MSLTILQIEAVENALAELWFTTAPEQQPHIQIQRYFIAKLTPSQLPAFIVALEDKNGTFFYECQYVRGWRIAELKSPNAFNDVYHMWVEIPPDRLELPEEMRKNFYDDRPKGETNVSPA